MHARPHLRHIKNFNFHIKFNESLLLGSRESYAVISGLISFIVCDAYFERISAYKTTSASLHTVFSKANGLYKTLHKIFVEFRRCIMFQVTYRR
jgi:hypothetical protein